MTGFQEFIPDADGQEVSLAVVNREAPLPLQQLLEDLFDRQSVAVGELTRENEQQDMVYLVTDDEVVARSPLGAVRDAILMANSDLYITGARQLEDVEVPAVIDGLAELPFRLRGYPESNSEKLLLITISRYIERLSLDHNSGKHRASFQQLSRIEDEQGTKTVYHRLADAEPDVHVYGLPDWSPPPFFELTIHGGWTQTFRNVWFVVHVPDEDGLQHAALVAVQTDARSWEGVWTYDKERVREINRHIERTL